MKEEVFEVWILIPVLAMMMTMMKEKTIKEEDEVVAERNKLESFFIIMMR